MSEVIEDIKGKNVEETVDKDEKTIVESEKNVEKTVTLSEEKKEIQENKTENNDNNQKKDEKQENQKLIDEVVRKRLSREQLKHKEEKEKIEKEKENIKTELNSELNNLKSEKVLLETENAMLKAGISTDLIKYALVDIQEVGNIEEGITKFKESNIYKGFISKPTDFGAETKLTSDSVANTDPFVENLLKKKRRF